MYIGTARAYYERQYEWLRSDIEIALKLKI